MTAATDENEQHSAAFHNCWRSCYYCTTEQDANLRKGGQAESEFLSLHNGCVERCIMQETLAKTASMVTKLKP